MLSSASLARPFPPDVYKRQVLIPVDELSERAEREFPDQRSLILVYCRSGRRSEQAARMLVEMGYNHVYDFGGINDWPYETVSGSEAGD